MTSPTHITVSGGLITAHFIEAMRGPAFGHPGVKPESFALPGKGLPSKLGPRSPAELEGQIAAAFELLVEQWDGIHAEIGRMDVATLRRRWLRHLWELLDFEAVYLRGDTVLNPGTGDELRFDLTYRGWEGDGPILHTVAPAQGLDTKPAGRERGPKGKPPHDMLQLFLNLSRTDRWAILTNGLALRLLRDYHHTSTRGYVEFDLEGIFESRNLADFRALYRMCHASRFVLRAEEPLLGNGGAEEKRSGGAEEDEAPAETAPPPPSTSAPLLESFHQDSQAAGVKVGEDLRGQVRAAIETLANGFLQGPLAAELARQPERVPDFYDEILHVIYRILFLLYAEQRAILPRRDAPLADLYREAYSLTALRERAAANAAAATDLAGDPYADLWEGLAATFAMVARGARTLGVTAYNGMLFDPGRTPILNGALTFTPAPLPARKKGEGVGVSNGALLLAIRYLTTVTREGSLQRISFADLGVEEVGSVYESLLDYHPRIAQVPELVEGRLVAAGEFFLDPRGSQRKTSGSYYTHPRPVHELVKSALIPVLEDRLRTAGGWDPIPPRTDAERVRLPVAYADMSDELRRRLEAALLAIKVCDSAMGSGHFLIAANNALALELARIRTGDEFPPEAAVMAARRDVLAHCIYGVDLNPMAVELAKVSLWINAAVPDQPLNFLDHHLKCGNSLIGAPLAADDRSPKKWCIPTEAFREKTGDNPDIAAVFRKRNQRELEAWRNRTAQMLLLRETGPIYDVSGNTYQTYQEIEALAEAQPNMARERYAAYLTDADTRAERLIADTWTAAFFWPLTPDAPEPPTQATFARLQGEGAAALTDAQRALVASLATEYRFFHWHLEFPGVFDERPTMDHEDSLSPVLRHSSGFTVLLGNPPWEMLMLMEKEFFESRVESEAVTILKASTGNARKRLIAELEQANPRLWREYQSALRTAEAVTLYAQVSRRYRLTASGRINTYAVFAELDRGLLAAGGRAGIIVPTGIATDYTYREFFADLMRGSDLASLYDFENRRGIFPAVDSRMKFCLLTVRNAAGRVASAPADFAFFLHDPDDLADPDRHFILTAADLALINPNTRTCPIFRARRDAELTRKLYRATPVFANDATGQSPWTVSFMQGLFNMTGDSGLFLNREQLDATEARMDGNRFVKGTTVYLPLYEGRMIGHYDHRASSIGVTSTTTFRSGVTLETSAPEHANPTHLPVPRYWVESAKTHNAIPKGYERDWFVAFKDVSSATNARTAIFSIIPVTAVGHTLPLLLAPTADAVRTCALLANLNSLPFDFIVRQKMGGIHLTFFILKQLPVLPPDRYTPALFDTIVPCVVELTYTAWDLLPFARDILAEAGVAAWNRWFPGNPVGEGGEPAPFTWQEARRAHLRAELDAIYARLYGLTAEELAYVLDTFAIVRRKDEAKWGEFRTKRLVMECFNDLHAWASAEIVR